MCILNTEGCNIFENFSSKDYTRCLDLMQEIILGKSFVANFIVGKEFCVKFVLTLKLNLLMTRQLPILRTI